jgi:hypothetical protein
MAAIPMLGYAFRLRIGNARLWQILFAFQVICFLIGIGALIYGWFVKGEKVTPSPYLLLLIPAIFILFFPWFMYAFRSPEIWRKSAD